uniref:3-oxoacyl-[acyl-carrier-protein] synthase n=1 Tax=Romanomermis culicivorax TaxID=13658 RepID=A0A915HH76_ROMCU
MVRVVITGLGLVTPLGSGVRHCWNAIRIKRCGIKPLLDVAYDKSSVKFAATVPEGKNVDQGEFDVERFSASQWRQMSRATALGLVAAEEAMKDAQWIPDDENQREYTGVSIGTGMLNFHEIFKTYEEMNAGGSRKVSPYFILKSLTNITGGHISVKYHLRGPNHSVSTACATSAHAIGDAFTMIKRGQAKVMICGGVESSICPLSVAGFSRLRALSSNGISRPFDAERNGFVMAEGAGILVLENLDHAVERRCEIYAELVGYGLSGDGSHLTAPDKNGRGAYLSMKRALDDAGLPGVDYINAHATSTPMGDEIECNAVEQLFLDRSTSIKQPNYPLISSTKGATGHMLGAAGSVEAIFTILALKHRIIPPTLNLKSPDFPSKLKFVKDECIRWPDQFFNENIKSALTNSFGFGGTNASLCFVEYK